MTSLQISQGKTIIFSKGKKLTSCFIDQCHAKMTTWTDAESVDLGQSLRRRLGVWSGSDTVLLHVFYIGILYVHVRKLLTAIQDYSGYVVHTLYVKSHSSALNESVYWILNYTLVGKIFACKANYILLDNFCWSIKYKFV